MVAADRIAAQLRDAVAAYQSGDSDKADRLFKKVASSRGAGPQAAFNYAIFLNRTGRPSDAAYWLDRVLRADAAYPGAAAERARLHFQAGEWPSAERLLARLDGVGAAGTEDRLLWLRALLECGRLDDADRLSNDLIRSDPALKPAVLKARTRRSKGRLTLFEGG